MHGLFVCPDADISRFDNKFKMLVVIENVLFDVLEHVYQQSEWLVPCILGTDMPLPCVGVSHDQSPNRDQGITEDA